MSAYLKSPCCGAPVVGMVDVTIHPRMRKDGSYGPIIDTLADIRYDAERSGSVDSPYCIECGATVERPK